MVAFLTPTTSSSSNLIHQRRGGCVSPSLSPQLINPLTSYLSVAPTLFDPTDVPISTPIVLLAAIALAVLAQSWINTMIGGEQGLGAFLSDGSGFSRSKFKPRKRDAGDVDPSKPLGGADPLPWLKLPEFDYVDVAGQPKKPKMIPNSSAKSRSNEAEVVSKLELLSAKLKKEVENDNLIEAKRIELELERIMEEEGFSFSSKQ